MDCPSAYASSFLPSHISFCRSASFLRSFCVLSQTLSLLRSSLPTIGVRVRVCADSGVVRGRPSLAWWEVLGVRSLAFGDWRSGSCRRSTFDVRGAQVKTARSFASESQRDYIECFRSTSSTAVMLYLDILSRSVNTCMLHQIQCMSHNY